MDSFWDNIFAATGRGPGTREVLAAIPVFASLTRRELDAIERILHKREYANGEVIFSQGDPGVGMYIVARGTVHITEGPTEETLSELRDGDFFGEIALLTEMPRSAGARAASNTTLFGFFQPDLLGLLQSKPRIGVKVLRALSEIAGRRLIRSDEKVRMLRNKVRSLESEARGPNASDRDLNIHD